MSMLLAMAVFSLVMSISPGPVNLITLSIGVRQGVSKAIPFVSGATIGFTLLLLAVGLGIGEVADRSPGLMMAINILGTVFLCYIGYLLLSSQGDLESRSDSSPDFLQGFLLQWLNPKAWAACVSGVGLFGASANHMVLLQFVTIYCVICFLGIGSWAFVGGKFNRLLNSKSRIRWFNSILGVVLIVIALVLFFQQ